MTTGLLTARRPSPDFLLTPRGETSWERLAVGGLYLMGAGVHLGIVAADPTTYQHFADAALFGFVRDGWRDIVMVDPAVWGLLLMVGEATLGVLLLIGGRAATVGWAGVIVFHLLLMLFGFGIWIWCLPALVVLGSFAHRDRLRRIGALATGP